MPAAIGFYTWVAAQKRTDRSIEAYSEHFKEKVQLPLDDLSGGATGHWSDLVRGVAVVLSGAGNTLIGTNFLIAEDIPLGSGMSSSASLEVATALALIQLSNGVVPQLELAKLCQKAEHEYVGTKVRHTPTRRVASPDVVKIAGQQSRYAEAHGLSPLGIQLRRPTPFQERLYTGRSGLHHDISPRDLFGRRLTSARITIKQSLQ